MIDHFTKWVKMASFSKVTKEIITAFIQNNIICRYDQPKEIVSNNAKNLNNYMMRDCVAYLTLDT